MSNVTLTEVIQATEMYASKARTVRNIKEAMQDEIAVIEKKYRQSLIDACKEAGEARQMVVIILESDGAADLFVKPKTLTVAGVTVGFRKQPGSISIPNEEGTIGMINAKMPDKMPVLLKTKVTVSKKVLSTLTADELMKIGVTIEADTDAPVVKMADDEIQELIDATIKAQMVEVA